MTVFAHVRAGNLVGDERRLARLRIEIADSVGLHHDLLVHRKRLYLAGAGWRAEKDHVVFLQLRPRKQIASHHDNVLAARSQKFSEQKRATGGPDSGKTV